MFKLHRNPDHATSIAAAKSVYPDLSDKQAEVLSFAKDQPDGFTDLELYHALGGAEATYRKRRTELTEKGLIVDTGTTRKHPGRRTPHTVWRVKGNAE